MHGVVDLNRGSGFVYGRPSTVVDVGTRVNAVIDAALVAADRQKSPRAYLGASRIGEPCARKLVYEHTHTPKDEGKDFDGGILRVFDAGHRFENLTIGWLRAAGFDLRTHNRAGEQFGFSVADGCIRGHIDGVIVAGPEVGIPWPALWEHKALKAASWNDLVKRGLKASKPVYWGQVQLYMAYMDLAVALFTAMNKDTQELYHELVAFDTSDAQALSDKAVQVIRAADSGELLPRVAAAFDHYLCRYCEYSGRCWETDR
jgi:hypothetical protein